MSADQVVYLEKFVDCTCAWLYITALDGPLLRFVQMLRRLLSGR